MAWQARAERVIPGGIHLSGRPLGRLGRAPTHFDRAKGARIWDVDGNHYIDFVMAFGPYLLGYAHDEVDGAAARQAGRGTVLSMNHPLHVMFIERLLGRFPGADMGVFLKTGSEATSAALRIARRATGRKVVARAGYHGWHDWCLPLEDFVPAGLDEQVLEFVAERPETLEALFRAKPDGIAAVILAPEMVIPTRAEPFVEIARLCRAHGAAFIMDEVKTALRMAPGSIQARVGVQPDLTTLSKALGNGYPVAAVLGRREIMQAGAGMHYSGTFHGDTSAMAAAMTTLDIVDREDVSGHVWRLGEKLIDGLGEMAQRLGVEATAYGEPLPPMPFLRFTYEDPEVRRRVSDAFYEGVFARGVLLHPRHMWFMSYAHSDADIDSALTACEDAMREARP